MTPQREIYLKSIDKGDRFELTKDEMTIGRSAASDLHFAFSEVSSKHATLKCAGEAWSVADLGSTNGTFVNDQRVAGETPLKDGDILRFGRKAYTFRCPPPAPPVEESGERTVVFNEEQPSSEKTAIFSSSALGAPVADAPASGGQISVSDFHQAFQKEAPPQAPIPPPPPPAAQSAPRADSKAARAGADIATPAPGAPRPVGDIEEMHTVMAKPSQMKRAAGLKVFAVLTEKTLSSRKKIHEITSIACKIGSATGNNIVLDDDSVVKEHLSITFDSPTRIMARLLDNNAALKVNGKFFKSQTIKDGDTIDIGDRAYIFTVKQLPVFRGREGGFLMRRKKLIAVAAILAAAFFGLYKLVPRDDTTPTNGPKGNPALTANLLEVDGIWHMVGGRRYPDALEQIKKYHKLEAETSGTAKFTAPPELADIVRTIEILKRSEDLLNNEEFYNAYLALEELPSETSKNLKVSINYLRKTKSHLERFAGEEYADGKNCFKLGDFQRAQTHFDKAKTIYPGYLDIDVYLKRVEIALHFSQPLEKVRESLKAERIDAALEQLDTITDLEVSDLTGKPASDIEAYKEQRETLLQHAHLFMMYKSGKGQEALDIFAKIPTSYVGYQDLELKAEHIQKVMKAYENALRVNTKQGFTAVLLAEKDPGIFYYQDSLKRQQALFDSGVARAKKLIAEGKVLQAQEGAKRYDALKKYFQAYQAEPEYRQASSICADLAKELTFEVYQMEEEKKREKFALYTIIIDNTPPDHKIHSDTIKQRELLK